jgi:hypothetical protein
MEVPATLFVVRGAARSSMVTASIENAIEVAVAGETSGDFRAVEITDWAGCRVGENALRREIDRRRAAHL